MATRTTNYNLAKPEMTDLVTPAQFNDNFDTIDTTMKSISDAASTAQTTANNAMPKSAYTLSGTTLTINW